MDCSLASALLARFPANGNHGNCPSRKFFQAQISTTGKQRAREIKSKENQEKFFFLRYLGGWWSLKDATATSSRHNKKLALRFSLHRRSNPATKRAYSLSQNREVSTTRAKTEKNLDHKSLPKKKKKKLIIRICFRDL